MTVIGLALAVWTTTSAATRLMKGLTVTYDRADERKFVRKRLVALAIVLALVVGMGLVVGLLVLGPHLERWIGDAADLPTLTAWLWWGLQWPILIGGLLVAFGVVLYLGPDVDQPEWKWITPGAVTALVIWLIASVGLAFYSAHFGSYEKTWGTLSAVVVTLLWLWLSSAALLFGAEINAETRRLAAAEGGASRAEEGSGGSAAEGADQRHDGAAIKSRNRNFESATPPPMARTARMITSKPEHVFTSCRVAPRYPLRADRDQVLTVCKRVQLS